MRKYEELYTVLVEIEGVLNNRPLTYLEEDDIKEPLTPIHLYCSHRILNSIKGEGHESDSHCSNNVDKHFQESTIGLSTPIFLEVLEKRLFIRAQTTYVRKKTKETNIKVNDIVTVLDENQKRNKWRLGKI